MMVKLVSVMAVAAVNVVQCGGPGTKVRGPVASVRGLGWSVAGGLALDTVT